MRVLDFVYEAGMSRRPGFYSGRRANTGDLDGTKLEKIHASIGRHVGEDAAEGFVDLVAGIDSLSATAFLIELQRLELNDWKWEQPSEPVSNQFVDSPGAAFATIVQAVAGNDLPDETDFIRWSFLKKHRPEAMRDYSPYSGWRKPAEATDVEDDDTFETDLRDDERDTLDEGYDPEGSVYSSPYRRGW